MRASRSALAARAVLFFASAAFLAAPRANAQEAQPFTSAYGEGVRVVPADPAGVPDDGALFMRADGNVGIGDMPFRFAGQTTVQRHSTTLSNEHITASFGISHGVTVFGNYFAAQTNVANSASSPLDTTNDPYLKRNPFNNYGDGLAGVRWRRKASDEQEEPLSFGAEGGAMFFGKSSSKGNGAGPQSDATSYFVRGMAGYVVNDNIRLTGNLGLSYDNTWNIWKDAFPTNTSAQLNVAHDGDPNSIFPEERMLLGVYGKKSGTLRELAGFSGVLDLSPAKPFVEITVEHTDSDNTFRLSPGLVFAPVGNGHGNLPQFLLTADLAPTGPSIKSSSPSEPLVRVGLGMVYSFGADSASHSRGGGQPGGHRRGAITVDVVGEDGRPLAGVRTMAVLGTSRAQVERTSDSSGRITLPDDEALMSIHAIPAAGFSSYSAHVGSGEHLRIVAVPERSLAAMQLLFFDEAGAPLTGGVHIALELPAQSVKLDIDATNGHFERRVPSGPAWKIVVVSDRGASQTIGMEGADTEVKHRLQLDSAGTHWTLDPPLAPQGPLRIAAFDPDLADVKSSPALQAATTRLINGPTVRASVVVVMKAGGDALMTDALAKARVEAMTAWFKKTGVPPGQVTITVEKGTDEIVRIEWR